MKSLSSDEKFSWEHAFRYAAAFPSNTIEDAASYAGWYMLRFWSDEGGIDELPAHSAPGAYNAWALMRLGFAPAKRFLPCSRCGIAAMENQAGDNWCMCALDLGRTA